MAKILIADDAAFMREMLRDIIQPHGVHETDQDKLVGALTAGPAMPTPPATDRLKKLRRLRVVGQPDEPLHPEDALGQLGETAFEHAALDWARRRERDRGEHAVGGRWLHIRGGILPTAAVEDHGVRHGAFDGAQNLRLRGEVGQMRGCCIGLRSHDEVRLVQQDDVRGGDLAGEQEVDAGI